MWKETRNSHNQKKKNGEYRNFNILNILNSEITSKMPPPIVIDTMDANNLVMRIGDNRDQYSPQRA